MKYTGLDKYMHFPTQGKLIAPHTENVTEYYQLFVNVFIYIPAEKKQLADNIAREHPGACRPSWDCLCWQTVVLSPPGSKHKQQRCAFPVYKWPQRERQRQRQWQRVCIRTLWEDQVRIKKKITQLFSGLNRKACR